MKRAWIFLFSFLLIFMGVMSARGESFDYKEFQKELREMRRLSREMQGENWTKAYYEQIIRGLNKQVPQIIENCMRYDNDTVMLHVQYGRYITAFNLCRKQEGSIEECIEKVRQAKEEWRSRCKDAHQSLSLFYFKELARAEEVRQRLQGMIPMSGCYGTGLMGLAASQSCAFMSQRVAEWFPGSNFNIASGTGTIVLGDGVIYYQGWQFIQREIKGPGGLVVQIFPQKINLTSGAYNIAVVFSGGKWNVIEFNLPFDSQTEKQFLVLGKGVRLTNKEIIDMVDRYLKDTVWETDLFETFQKLLLDGRERAFFMESLLEYYAYDNYLQKIKADAERQEKAAQQKQEQQSKQKQGGKKSKRRGA